MAASMAIIIFVVVVLLASLFWLISRRKAPHVDEEYSKRRPTASENPLDKSSGAEIERTTAVSARGQSRSDEEESGEYLELPEKVSPSETPDSAAAEAQSTGSDLFGKTDSRERSVSDVEIEAGQGLASAGISPEPLLAPVETSVQHDESAAQTSIGSVAVEESLQEPTTSDGGNGLQTANAVADACETVEIESPESELTAADAGAEEAQAAQEIEEAQKTPQRYRSPVQKSPQQPQPGLRQTNQETKRAVPSEVSLSIRIRLTFDRFDVCEIGLLPERTAGLDDEVTVKFGGISLLLRAQEEWYEDLHLEGIGNHLRQGVELKGLLEDQRRARWLLTGRDLYVLAQHPRASGFISTNRLTLGRSHVVLCIQELSGQVEALLSEAGCEGYTKLAEADGIPSRWVGLRGVSPSKAIPLDLAGSDPFYAIKPAPDIEIGLDRGICLSGSAWLAGYPPEIRFLGESNAAARVLIDGKDALRSADGLLTAEGYDLPGSHSVYCEGLSCSRSYSIEEAPDSWERWPAYRFGEGDICGPVVEIAAQAGGRRAVTVPMSNPVLLGAHPGEIFQCSRRSAARWKGFVPFEVVWALPAQPLRCDKRSASILQLKSAQVVAVKPQTKAALEWSVAVLDASRKGLRIENGSADSETCWRDYKKAARSIWRAAR